ncbi:glycerophosphoryl diester phosphodiesterase [Arthrobacter sp. PAMC 25486]|uniref:glycerophosphodiester phosphodiesterase n=1 Tax=Arthrobacter sp. PAMC 25486 TaxID=1494608 RepID=UPI000535B11B|nr:glycerophosphodiester phosphodiesterase [Arthrobacter sp. PAMC 25486]AIY02212.1 glycerophosphoryl diester phosphodiesterase [Arthrobacter sp. PAMC 25486]
MAQNKSPKPYLDSAHPVAIAHRGYSRDGLENSLTAFKSALELGYSYLETDINTTADGVPMVFHDATLDRTTDANGTIAALPYSVVGQARIAGKEPIATLDEFLAALPTARFNIDVKDAGSVGPLIEAIEKFGLHERVCVASFSDKRRRQVLARLSRPVASSPGKSLLVAYFLLSPWLPRRLLRHLMRDVDVLQVPTHFKGLELVTPATVRRAHKLGLKVHVWTINEPVQMHALFDLGVDGVMTDRADLLAEVMHQRGYWAS